jgi:hypothetical protein
VGFARRLHLSDILLFDGDPKLAEQIRRFLDKVPALPTEREQLLAGLSERAHAPRPAVETIPSLLAALRRSHPRHVAEGSIMLDVPGIRSPPKTSDTCLCERQVVRGAADVSRAGPEAPQLVIPEYSLESRSRCEMPDVGRRLCMPAESGLVAPLLTRAACNFGAALAVRATEYARRLLNRTLQALLRTRLASSIESAESPRDARHRTHVLTITLGVA